MNWILGQGIFRLRGWRTWLLLFCIAVSSPQAFATCTFYPGNTLQNMTINLSDVVAGRDTPPGTILASAEIAATKGTVTSNIGSPYIFASCTAPGNAYYAVNGSSLVNAGGLKNVFATNIPGIGIRIYSRNAQQGSSYGFTTPGTLAGSYAGDWGWYVYGNSWWGAQIIATGPVSSGQTDGSIYGTVTLDSLLVTYISITSFKVTAQACTTPDITVPMGTHKTTELSGIGSVTSATNFNINVNGCPIGMKSIQYEIDPTTALVSGTTSVASLDSSSTATGMGVQLLNGSGTPFALQTKTTFGGYTSSTGGSYSIPMQARYYQTAASVTAGSANTSMTLQMTYQ